MSCWAERIRAVAKLDVISQLGNAKYLRIAWRANVKSQDTLNLEEEDIKKMFLYL